MNTPIRKSTGNTNANRDPITGTPGSHPVGTGVGATLGGVAAGAAVGTVAGPVGTVVGAVAGAVVGGLAGKGVAEAIDPTQELNHWRTNFADRPYADRDSKFADYEPAYRYGVSSYGNHRGKSFDEVEDQLSRDWTKERGTSSMNWDRAKYATRDAWDRVRDTTERAIPGDSDNDGK